MRQSQGGINWNTASGGDFLCRHLTCGYGPPGAPKGTVSVRGGNVRRASRRKAASARASRHDAVHRAHPAGPALRACSARQSSLRTHGRGPRRCQPSMRDTADAHGAAVPLERWRGTLGTVDARSRATEYASRVGGLRRHPSALRWPPARGVAPPAARGRVFVRRRTLCAVSLCVTVDRASASTLWWVEWHQRRGCFERRANLARI